MQGSGEEFLRRYFGKTIFPSYLWGLLIFVGLLCIALIWERVTGIETFKKQIDLFGIAGIPLFFVTIIELVRTHRLQSAELVRSHMSLFLTNRDVYDAFHELIYNYSDDEFDNVRSLLPPTINRNARKSDAVKSQVWKLLEGFNEGRGEGSRFYDPDFFQGSLEERRLDSVLHYFDVIAYNYRNSLLRITDIEGVAGYHLAVIGTRKVTTYYLQRNEDYWKTLPYETRVGAEAPFENLRLLLDGIKRHNRAKIADILKKAEKQPQ
jgi:hypothetical protein